MNDFRDIDRYQLSEFLEIYNKEYGIHPNEHSMNFVIDKFRLRLSVKERVNRLLTQGVISNSDMSDIFSKFNINSISNEKEFNNRLAKLSVEQLESLQSKLDQFE